MLFADLVHPPQIMKTIKNYPKVIKLDSKASAMSRPVIAAEVEPCPEQHRSLMYGAEAPRPSSVHCFPGTKNRTSSSMMTTGGQSRKAMRSGVKEEGIGVRPGLSTRAMDVGKTTPALSNILWLRAGSALWVLKVAMEKYWFVYDAAFSVFEDL